MRTIKKISTLFLAVTFFTFITSCSSDSDGGGGGGTAGSGKITAKIAGSNFKSLEVTTMANLVSSVGALTIQGNNEHDAIVLMISSGYSGVGTYPISDQTANAIGTYIDVSNPNDPQTWLAPYEESGMIGEIEITSQTDNKISGTFFFKAKHEDGSTKEITEGSFNSVALMQQ